MKYINSISYEYDELYCSDLELIYRIENKNQFNDILILNYDEYIKFFCLNIKKWNINLKDLEKFPEIDVNSVINDLSKFVNHIISISYIFFPIN